MFSQGLCLSPTVLQQRLLLPLFRPRFSVAPDQEVGFQLNLFRSTYDDEYENENVRKINGKKLEWDEKQKMISMERADNLFCSQCSRPEPQTLFGESGGRGFNSRCPQNNVFHENSIKVYLYKNLDDW